MWKRHGINHVYQQPADDGTGAGGGAGGGSGAAGTTDSKAEVDAAVAAAVAGLKAKNTELLGALRDTKESLKRFDGIDPDAVRNILKRFSDDEEAGLIAKGEIDKVLTKRTERMKADYDKKFSEMAGQLEVATKRAQAFQGRVLDEAIRKAASKAGLHQHAIEDALFRGRALFTLDDHDEAVALGEDGKPIFGKDGKSPFTPLEWLEGMKEKAPHWFPATASGSGAIGSGPGVAGQKTITRAQFDAMNPAERMAFAKANGKVV